METPRILALVFLSALCAAPAGARPREKTLLSDFAKGDTEERIRLAPALGRMKDKKSVDALLGAFDVRRASPRELCAVVAALGASGDPRAAPEVADAEVYLSSMGVQMGELTAPLQVLREKMLEALGRLGGERAVSILRESVNDKDPSVVEEAVRGLGRLQVKDSIPALEPLAARGGDMTQAVFEAFAAIGDKRAEPALEQGLTNPDKFVGVEAAYALATLGRKDMIARLNAALQDESGSAKADILAAYYLAKMDRTSGLDHLVGLMKKTDSDLSVLAADALGKTENPRAVLPLVEALASDDSALRLSIVGGLGRLGGVRAVAALRKLSEDPNPGVHAAALAALAELGEVD
jgi:HEAT repeat protein